MEQTTQATSWPQQEKRGLSVRLPRYIPILSAIIAAFALVNIAVRAVMHDAPAPSDPFEPYADISSGQPHTLVEWQGFSCRWGASNGIFEEKCNLDAPTGAFSHIEVAISVNEVVRYVTFIARKNALRLGDLMIALGTPEIQKFGHSAYFYWRDGAITAGATTYAGRYSPYLPLAFISFADPPAPEH